MYNGNNSALDVVFHEQAIV